MQPVFKAGKTTVFVTPPENITVTGLAIAEDLADPERLRFPHEIMPMRLQAHRLSEKV